jgi:hypothetical protein
MRRVGWAELMTGIEGITSRPVRKIVLVEGWERGPGRSVVTNSAPLGWRVWRQIGQGKPYGRLYRTRVAAEVAKARWVTKYGRYADTVLCVTPIYSKARPAKPRHSLQRHNPDQMRLAQF